MACEWSDKIFSVSEDSFEQLALDIFRFQYQNNPVYHSYVNALQIDSTKVRSIDGIPFLPINFFKSHKVTTGEFESEVVFDSSGTTQSIKSYHYVKNTGIYRESFTKSFEMMFGPIQDWCIIGLLPSCLERENSSLVYMVNNLIKDSGSVQSGFYLNDPIAIRFEKLIEVLTELENRKQKTLLIGVTFALLDFAEKYQLPLTHTLIMETGGMKGRREELTRMEVHEILKKAFGKEEINSEYGMTELLSQSWSKGKGKFICPPWMKIVIREEEDPFEIKKEGNGAINIIDLANVYSCSFIATDDAGRINADKTIEILGRLDGSDLRGCSLLTL